MISLEVLIKKLTKIYGQKSHIMLSSNILHKKKIINMKLSVNFYTYTA